jgi:hypothetical protein
VKDKLHQDMVQEEFNTFMKSMEARFKVDVKDAAFFAPGPGPR